MRMSKVECPVCTLYLREGISLQEHLFTHPKNQVIEALVRISTVPNSSSAVVVPTSECSGDVEQPPYLQEAPFLQQSKTQRVTSITTYQQFLSSTTSIISPSQMPPPPPLSPHPPSSNTLTRVSSPSYQYQYPSQEKESENGENYSACYPESRPSSAIQYTELENYTPENQQLEDGASPDNEVNAGNADEDFMRPNMAEHEVFRQPNANFTSSDLGTVITESQRVISNSPTGSYNYSTDDQNRTHWTEETDGMTEGVSVIPEVHSPTSRSSSCSVRVRKDLGDNKSHEENSLLHLTPPRNESNEYIVPGFEYEQLEDNNCNNEEDQAMENSNLSIHLNIHTDESMPPRGELSGHGTNSSVWQVDHENIPNFGVLREERWVQNKDESERYKCTQCCKDFTTIEERTMHASLCHQVTIEPIPAETIPPSHQDTFSNVFVKAEQVRVIEEVKTLKSETSGDSKVGVLSAKSSRRPARTCRTCDKSFPNSEDFKFHIRKVHPLECTVCGKCFVRTSGLALHQKRHLKIRPFKCDLCDKTFVTSQKLMEHRNGHTGERPFKCLQCPQTFKRYSNYLQHKQYIHMQKKRKVKDFHCYCGDVFHSKRKLMWHQETHETKPKQCPYCNERFVHNSSLTRHIRRAHDNKYLPKFKEDSSENVECPICHQTYLKGSLRNHILIHSGMKPYSCTTCGKKFLTKWNMKLHQWTHAARTSKPFKCAQCKAAFVRETDYHAHLRSHKNVRPYSCNHCGQQFARKYNCIRHMREHETEKNFTCNVCGKKFHRGYYLIDHMKTHTGVKPYSCHICSKTTATKTNHNKHLRTHHAREPVNSEN